MCEREREKQGVHNPEEEGSPCRGVVRGGAAVAAAAAAAVAAAAHLLRLAVGAPRGGALFVRPLA